MRGRVSRPRTRRIPRTDLKIGAPPGIRPPGAQERVTRTGESHDKKAKLGAQPLGLFDLLFEITDAEGARRIGLATLTLYGGLGPCAGGFPRRCRSIHGAQVPGRTLGTLFLL